MRVSSEKTENVFEIEQVVSAFDIDLIDTEGKIITRELEIRVDPELVRRSHGLVKLNLGIRKETQIEKDDARG